MPLRLSHASAGEFEATVASDDGAWLMPVAAPAVVAIAPGPAPIRPRYPYPARIANAWQPGLVEICTPRELGLDAEALAPDVEPGGLVLPPERTRGEVIGGSVQEAAEQLVGILRMKRMIG